MARWNFMAVVRTAEPSVHSAYGHTGCQATLDAPAAAIPVAPRHARVQSSFLRPLAQPRGWRATFLDY